MEDQEEEKQNFTTLAEWQNMQMEAQACTSKRSDFAYSIIQSCIEPSQEYLCQEPISTRNSKELWDYLKEHLKRMSGREISRGMKYLIGMEQAHAEPISHYNQCLCRAQARLDGTIKNLKF